MEPTLGEMSVQNRVSLFIQEDSRLSSADDNRWESGKYMFPVPGGLFSDRAHLSMKLHEPQGVRGGGGPSLPCAFNLGFKII